MLDVFVLDKEIKSIKPEELARYKNKLVWIDVTAPKKEDFKLLREIFKLHPLTIEDCLSKGKTRIKIEYFENYMLIVLYGVSKNGKRPYEVDFILGKNFLISNHYEVVESIEALKKNSERVKFLISSGVDSLLHRLIDAEVDQFLNVLGKYDEIIDKFERKALEAPTHELTAQIFRLRRLFVLLRRLSNAQKEKILELTKADIPFITKKVQPYFRDVFDHMLTITDTITNYRELLSNILEVYLSTVSNKMNEIMKTLTVVTTIMLPLTLIAGIYGMNFQFLPELHWKYGYMFALGLMVAIAVGMIFYFRRKGWF